MATKPPELVDARTLTPDEYRAARAKALRGSGADHAARDAADLAKAKKRHATNPPTPRSTTK